MQVEIRFRTPLVGGSPSLGSFTPTSPFAPRQEREADGPADAVSISTLHRSPAASAPPARFRGLHKLGLTAVLALGGVGALMSGSVALAAEAAPQLTVAVAASGASSEEQLARRAGLSKSAVDVLSKDAVLRAKTLTLPQDFADLYGAFNATQKSVIGKLLSGTTRVFVAKVDNREAFVKGRALGQDAFPHMLGRIDDEVEKGSLTPGEGEQMKSSVGKLKSLTPEQRDTIATIIHLDQGRLAAP